MSGTIRHCRNCGCQTRHRHVNDCAESLGIFHIYGTERFECIRCKILTFAYSEGAHRFPFALDVAAGALR